MLEHVKMMTSDQKQFYLPSRILGTSKPVRNWFSFSSFHFDLTKIFCSRAVVVVKRSAYLPSITMIRVRIPLTSRYSFSVKFVFEKNEINKKKRPGLAHVFAKIILFKFILNDSFRGSKYKFDHF